MRDFDVVQLDRTLAPERQAFAYFPFMHSENSDDQEQSVQLFSQSGLEDNLKWALHHRDIVRRFGRFPHRNAILRRQSHGDELEFLKREGVAYVRCLKDWPYGRRR